MKKSEVEALFKKCNDLSILVVGDVMIDRYLWGDVERISPEAPVPVIHAKEYENRLGGAANVALNIKAMGANPVLCSVIGDDRNGEKLLALLEKNNLSQQGIVVEKNRLTTVKTRIISQNHHILRIDEESTYDIGKKTQNSV
ncbi:bifunctional heptose 7-phosphate kinase/heptose 1-phosphate adenyltransferase, partial [Bacteroidota bacterium]